MTAAEQRLLTYAEAGQRLGVGIRFIRNAVATGRLRGVDLGYRAKRIAELDLLAFIESSRTVEKGRR